MKRLFWGVSLCLLSLLLLMACATTAGATQSASQSPATATTAATAIPFSLGCPGTGIQSTTSSTAMTVHPDSGPVGTRITVAITGAEPGCRLTLNISVPPSLSETQNTPDAKPGLSYPVQWIMIGADDALTMPFCVCAIIPTWIKDNPQITSTTPQPGAPDTGDYAPAPHDYFFFTLGGPGIPSSSPVFAKFTVTG